jgi:hypothetical protein
MKMGDASIETKGVKLKSLFSCKVASQGLMESALPFHGATVALVELVAYLS